MTLSGYYRHLTTPSPKPIRTVTTPAVGFEPVSIEQVRYQCNLGDNSAFDDGLLLLIQAARETVERDTGIACATGTYTYRKTIFPCDDWFELYSLRPITALGSITYVDTSGTTQTWSSAEYTFDNYSVCPLVRLNYGYVWPIIRGDINGITISVTAGYTSQALVPAQIKQACLLLVSHWFENRGAVITGTISKDIEFAYTTLIDSLERKHYS